jgi:hypothetical protein
MRTTPSPSLTLLPEPRRRLLHVSISCVEGVLYSQRHELVNGRGGVDRVTLVDLSAWYNEKNSGLNGQCFEQAVHAGLRDGEDYIAPFVRQAARDLCGFKGEVTSVQFAPENDRLRGSLTPAVSAVAAEARLYLGDGQMGPKLKDHILELARAVNSAVARRGLPPELAATYKSDIFLGSNAELKYAGTTIKINPELIEAGPGLPVAIYPQEPNRPETPRIDKKLDIVRIPLPYENAFTELFGIALKTVTTFLAERDARIPPWERLPEPDRRWICAELERRRDKPVVVLVQELRAATTRAAGLNAVVAKLI